MKALDLDQLHQAILESLKTNFPQIPHVFDYLDTPTDRIKTPALTVQLSEMEFLPAEDAGTEQLPVKASFTAYMILAATEPQAERRIRKLATDVALTLHGQRWGLTGIFPAEVSGFSVDQFEPEQSRVLVWSIEFTQQFTLGKSVWDDDAFPARLALQLGKKLNDPNQPLDQQLKHLATPILAMPKDPEQPEGEWQYAEHPNQVNPTGDA